MAFEILVEIPENSPTEAPRKAELLPRPLPVELHRGIVQNVDDRATLLALCTTSYVFKAEAERILYHSMTQTLAKADEAGNAHLAFLRTITTIKHLSALVQTYHLPKISFLDVEAGREFPYLLRCALQSMVNLRELWLDISTDMIQVLGSDTFIFDHCSFQLESLRLTQTHSAHELVAFLVSQSRLRQVSVSLVSDGHVLPATVCPHLEVLQGNRNTINVLLPDREIKTLIYDPDTYELNEPISHLSEPLGRLQVLSLGGYYMRPSLHVLASFLNSLEYLELISLHAGEIEVVCQLPSLRGLVLTEALSLNAWERRPSIVASIFSRSSNLQFIDIQKIYFRGCASVYQRWTLPFGSNVPVFQESLPKEIVRQKFTACSHY